MNPALSASLGSGILMGNVNCIGKGNKTYFAGGGMCLRHVLQLMQLKKQSNNFSSS